MSQPPLDLTGLTLAELQQRRDQIENDLASVKAKLDQVRAQRVLTGNYADPDWYRRATTRQRFLGVEHQAVTRRIAELKREARAAVQAKVEAAFLAAAKRLLAADQFDAILAEAQATAGGAA